MLERFGPFERPIDIGAVSQAAGGEIPDVDVDATGDADGLTADAYAQHAGRLRALLARAYPTIADGDDIVQEAFVRLLVALRSGDTPGSTGAWLSTVCLNLARSHGRHRQVVQRRLPSAIDPATPAMPDRVVLAYEDARALGIAMDTLRGDSRRVIELAATGESGSWVAAHLGRSELATRTLLCRSRRQLREALAEPA
jgi:RNA polymerase sigma factor (sigma-70 family)